MSQSGTNPGGITPFPAMSVIDELPQLPDGSGVALATPFRVGVDELAGWLDGIEVVGELPPDSSGVEFVRFGNGYYGVPFCESPADGMTCFPVGPGPDDDPFGYNCVCLEPGDPGELVGVLSDDKRASQSVVRPKCSLHRVNQNVIECRRVPPVGCMGRCQVVRLNPPLTQSTSPGSRAAATGGRVILGCICAGN